MENYQKILKKLQTLKTYRLQLRHATKSQNVNVITIFASDSQNSI